MKNKTYSTIQGDMWDGIAMKVFGNESYMDKLIEANPSQQTRVIFPANIVLNIPVIAVPTSSNLPPWKRGDND
ncbi:phage tail protein [Paenibacillus psychroresistens]|uniref:Phage tail protein n=1 Tax=Paenibacillus psychroresistens TaxID=1778678 RepID=A0A6B8RHC0_9BACL|nr:tail protein X [Paenibacillus psychroresistens]QGQ95871.1 phage tail protein [Paenibacillus psychroresistens]